MLWTLNTSQTSPPPNTDDLDQNSSGHATHRYPPRFQSGARRPWHLLSKESCQMCRIRGRRARGRVSFSAPILRNENNKSVAIITQLKFTAGRALEQKNKPSACRAALVWLCAPERTAAARQRRSNGRTRVLTPHTRESSLFSTGNGEKAPSFSAGNGETAGLVGAPLNIAVSQSQGRRGERIGEVTETERDRDR